MRVAALSGLVMLGLLAGGALVLRFWPNWTWVPAKQALEANTGVRVALEDITFPERMRRQGVLYRPTLGVERYWLLGRLELDLSRYSRGFLSENLSEIAVLRSLEVAGYPYGGTYDVRTGRVFIDSAWLGDDASGREAMGFHHEFNSLLMRRYPGVFDENEWRSLNPPGFAYRFDVSSSANIASGELDLAGDPKLWEQGFVCGYGRLTMEDDINTFAQFLVPGGERRLRLEADYPRLREKMRLLARWYCEIGAPPADTDCRDLAIVERAGN